MSATIIFLAVALICRVVLDLFTLSKTNYYIDFAYFALYLVVGVFLVFDNTHDIFGYLCLGLALFFGWKGVLALKSANEAKSKSDIEIPPLR